ncbi:hypothetical protein HaLaN_27491, partial [Haematococcus lacustris]
MLACACSGWAPKQMTCRQFDGQWPASSRTDTHLKVVTFSKSGGCCETSVYHSVSHMVSIYVMDLTSASLPALRLDGDPMHPPARLLRFDSVADSLRCHRKRNASAPIPRTLRSR